MGAFLLTVDLGNSAAKLRLWSERAAAAPECVARLDLDADGADLGRVETFLAGRTPAWAAVSNVAPEPRAAGLRGLFARIPDGRWLADPDCGLANDTREPGRVGRDRLHAARGALELLGGSAVVVDAGTTVTVDAVIAGSGGRPGNPRGVFLGGAIAPGPRLLAQALAQGAARLFPVTPVPDAKALGRDSAEAMRAGIGVGLRGAVRELVREVAREAGLVDPPIALTGGARAFVAPALAGRRVVEHADLVHVGLVSALLERAGRALEGSAWRAR